MIDTMFCSPLLTPAEMNAWDRASASMGLKTEILMENASREALHALKAKLGDLRGKTAVCFAGSGNNGGDAIALARHLDDAGADVILLLAKPVRQYSGPSGLHLRIARQAGLTIRQLGQADLSAFPQPDIVVDGLLGTGLAGPLRPDYAAWIEAVNRMGERAFTLALDIPSGLSGLTGDPAKPTVIADLTVTFEAAKIGLCLPQASPFVGELEVRPIGMPRAVREAHPPAHYLLGPELAILLPGLDAAMHKGQAGRLLIIGGSPGLTGAPVLAAMGALRAGAGLVTVACPRGIEPTLKSGYPDVMTLPLGDSEAWTEAMAEELLARMDAYDAVVIGPGIGREERTGRFLEVLAGGTPPAVWDADALFWLAGAPRRLPGSVCTPHPGEAARILGCTIQQVEADRQASVRELARLTGGTAVLKGPASALADGSDPHGRVFLSPFAEPNLAVGGSGDVLAGVTGSLLARGLSPLLAACLGVYWHGLAGRLVSGEFPYRGNLASEIVQALPRALTEWLDADG